MAYAIYAGNMDRLMKKITRIKNKCEKYGCDFRFEEVGEEYRTLTDENGEEYTARFVLVEAEGIAKKNGWQFVATVQHTENGNIITGVADIEVPERYYNSDPICEHCNSKRVRKDTYIVMNEAGEFKQVGKTCLMDFTNGMDAGWVASYMSLYKELIEAKAPMAGFGTMKYYDVEEYLGYAFETVKHFGYVKRDDGYCTADRVMNYWIAEHGGHWNSEVQQETVAEMRRVGFDADSNAEDVQKALEWVAEQEADGNYIHNLKVICENKYAERRNLGLLVSLVPTFNRALERQEQDRQRAEKAAETKWVGEVGKRITFKVQDVNVVTGWETQWGYTRVYKITDTDGNIYTWKTSAWIEEHTEQITGTVKAHNEYRGEKQTELTRCKCTVNPPQASANPFDEAYELFEKYA